ncbi:hypothetical protein ES703_110589 [subsurface metagenome]
MKCSNATIEGDCTINKELYYEKIPIADISYIVKYRFL